VKSIRAGRNLREFAAIPKKTKDSKPSHSYDGGEGTILEIIIGVVIWVLVASIIITYRRHVDAW